MKLDVNPSLEHGKNVPNLCLEDEWEERAWEGVLFAELLLVHPSSGVAESWSGNETLSSPEEDMNRVCGRMFLCLCTHTYMRHTK